MAENIAAVSQLLSAISFAAQKHRGQTRKDGVTPYINHPIEVAELLSRVGRVTDLDVLRAAVLHDTLEDTETSARELEQCFGPLVTSMVREVTYDQNLPREVREREQIERAPRTSYGARLIKLADMVSNVRDLPDRWSDDLKRKYIAWTGRVADGIRGTNTALEAAYDASVAEAGERLSRAAAK